METNSASVRTIPSERDAHLVVDRATATPAVPPVGPDAAS
jgi:hypothetical protein